MAERNVAPVQDLMAEGLEGTNGYSLENSHSSYWFFVPSEASKLDGKTRPGDNRRRDSLRCFFAIKTALSAQNNNMCDIRHLSGDEEKS